MSCNGRSREAKRRKKQIREEEIKNKHKTPVGDWGQHTAKSLPLVGLSKSLQQSSGPRLKCEEHNYTNLSLVVFI